MVTLYFRSDDNAIRSCARLNTCRSDTAVVPPWWRVVASQSVGFGGGEFGRLGLPDKFG